MTTHVNTTESVLAKIWLAAANAVVTASTRAGSLHGSFCHFALDNTLQSDSFMERTKRLEEKMQMEAKGVKLKKAIRSTASSSRSVVNIALEQGRTVVRSGKPVGKTRLENEAKACEAGHAAKKVMEADTDALKSMSHAGGESEGTRSAEQKVKTLDSESVMNVADNLKAMLDGASDDLVSDLAFEILHADPRLTLALQGAVADLKAGRTERQAA